MLIPLLLGGRKSPLMAPLPPVLQATGLFTRVPDLALTVSFHSSCHLLDRVPVLIRAPGPLPGFLLLAFLSCLCYTPFALCSATPLVFCSFSVPQFVQLDACCISVHFSILCLASLAPSDVCIHCVCCQGYVGHQGVKSWKEERIVLADFPPPVTSQAQGWGLCLDLERRVG